MKDLFIVDLSIDKSKINPYLSETLLKEISANLKNKEKTLLYINKRGAFNMTICNDCNNIEKCENCDLSLSVHNSPKKLICHHCWFKKDYILQCSNCGSTNIQDVWIWTQQIENTLLKVFPQAKIFRMDTDSLRNKTLKSQALENIEKSDIIIWTKMMTTGFNFKKLKTIWVILIEQELNIPSYDTEENLYSNIKQLIWRWWRVWQHTNIIVQTYTPTNSSIQNIINLNYKDFFKSTLEERKMFNYPPFCELAYFYFKGNSREKSYEEILKYKNILEINNLKNNLWAEIILVENILKREKLFISSLIIKAKDSRAVLQVIKKDILKNSNISVVFK